MIANHHEKTWILETRSSGYAFGVNRAGLLVHTYWGPRLPRCGDYPAPPESEGWASFNGPAHLLPEEYPAYGGTSYVEPCLKVSFADGTRDADLRFIHAEPGPDGLSITLTLRDALYPLWVRLHYRAWEEQDLIERWASVENHGSQPITVERIFSAQWHLPPGHDYRFTHLSGRWADEFQLMRESLTPGVKVIESRRLTTSHHANPWFALDPGCASEDDGEVWFGLLAWSGNWKLAAEVTDFASTRLSLGVNDWDFALCLEPGGSFTTPPSLAGYTRGGFGAASRLLHDHIRAHVLPNGTALRRVLYNSWEATQFDVDEESQARLAEIAAGLGVELFVLDDGWFHRRSSDRAGLGDWTADPRKFPNGLGGLIQRVNDLGMDFGLWVEPEMVNPDSDLYRAHPEWTIHFPTRVPTEARNQLILNFARADVQEYILTALDRLLSEHNITFIKWDMNRNVSQPGWPGAAEPRELWVRYVEGLYRVWGQLQARHPRVTWQSCSGGGGRADLGILRLADQIWVSDNTEAAARLRIQEGFSQIFPANVMEAWVTDLGDPLLPLEFRFHVSMCGSLGIGGNLLRWGAEERALAARLVAQYKDIRPIVQLGKQYRLRSPRESGFSAVQYVDTERSEAVLFAFRAHLPEPAHLPPLALRGLDAQGMYLVDGLAQPRSGAAWMAGGLQLSLPNFGSTLRRIRRIG